MTKSMGGLGLLGLAAGVYALVVRPRLLRSGATDEEARGAFPGADIIPNGERGATMAATIDAPPSRVWPWLVQMGYDRAGWYSWDRLNDFGKRSTLTSLAIGQHLHSTPDARHWFEVAALEPQRFLALRAAFRGPLRRQYDSSLPRPRTYVDALWAFWLKELPGGRTRVIVSLYTAARPRWLNKLAAVLFWEPAHWIMQRRQFTNLKRRVVRERLARWPETRVWS